MPCARHAWEKVTSQPARFTVQVLKAFQKNQGLLLSGALAYYTLLPYSCPQPDRDRMISSTLLRMEQRSGGAAQNLEPLHRPHHSRRRNGSAGSGAQHLRAPGKPDGWSLSG